MALTQVNSGGINDNSIVNADLHSAANIASTKLAKPIDLADNEKVRFGTGNDLEIYHDGDNSFIKDTGTGRLTIATSQLQLTNAADSEVMVKATQDGAVDLYHNNSRKFSTASDGVSVVGNLGLGDGNVIQCGQNSDLRIQHSGSNSFIETSTGSTGDLYVISQGTNHDLYLRANDDIYIQPKDGEDGIKVHGDGSVELYHDNSKKLETNSNGVRVSGRIEINGSNGRIEYNNTANTFEFVTGGNKVAEFLSNGHFVPGANNTYNLGSSNAKFGNVFSDNFVGSGGLKSVQVFTASGTWTRPTGITQVRVTVTGGGGGGGGGTNSYNTGQGGGAGGTAIEIIDVSSVSSVTVTVGGGGAGATGHTQNTSGANGSSGGTSSFGSYCSATGGEGGDEGWGNVQDLGNGGTGSGGDINLPGGDAVSKGGGNDADQTTASLGGASYWGGGGKGGSRGNNGIASPKAGKAYGSGGGGGGAADGTFNDGGAGKAGIVVVEEFA